MQDLHHDNDGDDGADHPILMTVPNNNNNNDNDNYDHEDEDDDDVNVGRLHRALNRHFDRLEKDFELEQQEIMEEKEQGEGNGTAATAAAVHLLPTANKDNCITITTEKEGLDFATSLVMTSTTTTTTTASLLGDDNNNNNNCDQKIIPPGPSKEASSSSSSLLELTIRYQKEEISNAEESLQTKFSDQPPEAAAAAAVAINLTTTGDYNGVAQNHQSFPGAFPIPGMNNNNNNNSNHHDRENSSSGCYASGRNGTTLQTTTDMTSSNNNNNTTNTTNTHHEGQIFLVPIAETVSDKVFNAVVAEDADHAGIQNRNAILMLTVTTLFIIVGAIVGGVMGATMTSNNKDNNNNNNNALQQTKLLVQWNQVGNDIFGEATEDRAGNAIAISGNGLRLAVASLNYDNVNANETDVGYVRVYQRIEDEWVQLGIPIEGEASGDLAGTSVALSHNGSILAIGAYHNDGSNGTHVDAGNVRVYEWSSSSTTAAAAGWIQRGQNIDGDAMDDGSGFSVALSGDGSILAIGAPGNDGNGCFSGQARVFGWNTTSTSWIQLGSDIYGEAEYDFSGESVSLSSSGHILAIGAFRNDGNGVDSGQVRVYEWDDNDWIQKGQDIDGSAAGDEAGTSPSVVLSDDGNTVAIGASLHHGSAGEYAGQVRVFDFTTTSSAGAWIQRGQDIEGAAGDEFGSSVAISSDGTVLAVGAMSARRNGNGAGAVRMYSWTGSLWVQLGDDIDGTASADNAGVSVAMSADGRLVAVGAFLNDGTSLFDSNVGQVRVYERVD